MIKRVTAAIGIASLALALTACADGPKVVNPLPTVPSEHPVTIEKQFRGYPPGLQDFLATAQFAPDDNVGYVFWKTGKASIYLTTFGSSSCPLTPARYLVTAPTRVTVVATAEDGPCTADLSATTFQLAAFPGLSRSQLVHVDLTRRYRGGDQGVSDLKLGSSPTFTDANGAAAASD